MENIILGAGGHASEVLDILWRQSSSLQIVLFNNTVDKNYLLFDKFQVLFQDTSLNQFQTFYLGVGSLKVRKILSTLGLNAGLQWKGIRSDRATIGHFNVKIHETVDMMDGVRISSNVQIGKGTLLNRNANIHHDVRIGTFCEIAPSAQLLGHTKIGDNVFIGTGAIILPHVTIGSNCIIGAGSVVLNDVLPNSTVVGVPAKKRS